MSDPPPVLPEPPWPVAVIGAGAAGLLAAIFAARTGARVVALETRPVPGAKIRVSGGGRCNILPSRAELGDYATSGSRNTMRNLLFSWPLHEVRRFFEEELRISMKVEPNGKVFPSSDRSQDVVAALLKECQRRGVTILGGRSVQRIESLLVDKRRLFRLGFPAGSPMACGRLILATGGLSLPRTGSDGHGLEMARSLGHAVRSLHPALVPLLAVDPRWRELSGISLPVRLRATGGGRMLEEREGDLLFTHRGFSGPVVLDLSRHVTGSGGEQVRIEAAWLGSNAPDWGAILREPGRRSVAVLLGEHLPRRLADQLLLLARVPGMRTTSELRREEREQLVRHLTACSLEVAGSEGYATAEVTAGGVPLEEISPRTLESRIVPGLYFAGEILDVVGRIGGFNFLWAWVTGRRAGEAAATNLEESRGAPSS